MPKLSVMVRLRTVQLQHSHKEAEHWKVPQRITFQILFDRPGICPAWRLWCTWYCEEADAGVMHGTLLIFLDGITPLTQ
jgi:hypothetical protein